MNARHERDRKVVLRYLRLRRLEELGTLGVLMLGRDPKRDLFDDGVAAAARDAVARLAYASSGRGRA